MGWADAFAYQSPADIFAEHAALSAFENDGGRAFDIGALAGADYDTLPPTQWPAKASPNGTNGTARLFAEGGFPTSDTRARFVAVRAEDPATSTSAEYPFILNTGRIRDQWHTMTRTGLVPRLSSHIAEPFVAINPTDAAALNLADDDLAVLRSSQGEATLRVRVTPDQPQGQLFAPMHWNRRFSGNGGINALTAPVTDAISGQPELKHTPAALTPFKPAWTAFLITRGETVPASRRPHRNTGPAAPPPAAPS